MFVSLALLAFPGPLLLRESRRIGNHVIRVVKLTLVPSYCATTRLARNGVPYLHGSARTPRLRGSRRISGKSCLGQWEK